MILAFTLTMPGRNTWNGRWSGEGELFVITRNLGQSKAARKKGEALLGDHSYSWSWRANIKVNEVDAAEARRLRAKSRGFLGCSWMVDSLLLHGDIRADDR